MVSDFNTQKNMINDNQSKAGKWYHNNNNKLSLVALFLYAFEGEIQQNSIVTSNLLTGIWNNENTLNNNIWNKVLMNETIIVWISRNQSWSIIDYIKALVFLKLTPCVFVWYYDI